MRNHLFSHAKWFAICILLMTGIELFGQSLVTGKVTESGTNDVLIGASIKIKGKTTGTITDLDGKFSIQAQPTDVLVFSYVGMKNTEVKVGTQKIIDVVLESNSQVLNEVVAIGYGTVKKSDLTGSVGVVSTKDLTKIPTTSAAQALQGRVPGVVVTQSGDPGSDVTIRVRGVGSITRSSDPIYIVDGIMTGSISGIQPQDIESMQVLKDASATAIYGANGSNGVILITTKRGKSGKTQITFSANSGISLEPTQYRVMNASEYSDFYSKINGNLPEYQQSFRERYYGQNWQEGTNWQDEVFKKGSSSNYNLSVAGGGETSNFNISFGYTNDQGTVQKTSAERYRVRANSDFKIGKYLKIGENMSISYSTGESPVTYQSSVYNLQTSPLMRVFNDYYIGGYESPQTVYWEDSNGDLHAGAAPANYTGTIYKNTLFNDKTSPMAALMLGSNKRYSLGTAISSYLQVDFNKDLMFKTTPSAELSYGRTKNWLPGYEGNRHPATASLSENYYETLVLSIENQLTYKKLINNIHNIQLTAVQSYRHLYNHNMSGTKTGFNFEELNVMAGGGTASTRLVGYEGENILLSYLGRVMYDYAGKYYLTASLRSDGVNLFAPSNRRGYFPSASIMWKVSEDFFKDVREIDLLKFRVGWGSTGNSNIGSDFQYYDKITEASNFSPVFGRSQTIANAQYIFYGMASGDIHWESADMINVGTDINLFKNKLQLTFEYYYKSVSDLLLQIPISYSFGRQDGNPWFNLGNIHNTGIEISGQWRDQIGKLGYGINASFTTTKNNVDYMPISDVTTTYNRTKVGYPIGSLFGYRAERIIQSNENYNSYPKQSNAIPQPGDLKYTDMNDDGVINELDKTIIGKTIPSLNLTLGLDLNYKNFDFNVFMYGLGDYQIYNYQRASMSSMNYQDMDHNKLLDYALNHWSTTNPSTKYVRVDPSNKNLNDQISSWWIEDGSFLRIKDIQLGYNFDQKLTKKLSLNSLRLYVSATNMFTLTKYKGRDPEGFASSDPLNSGVDQGAYSNARSFNFGIQLGL